MLKQNIKLSKNLDWNEIAKIPIIENNDLMLEIISNAKLKVSPIYYQQGLNSDKRLFLRQQALISLLEALNYLPEHFGFEILDAWRPLRVQKALLEQFRQQIKNNYPQLNAEAQEELLDEFVANPERSNFPPPHLTGGAVDLTLFSLASGQTLDMGSAFDEVSPISYALALEEKDCPARDYRRALINSMHKAGFTVMVAF